MQNRAHISLEKTRQALALTQPQSSSGISSISDWIQNRKSIDNRYRFCVGLPKIGVRKSYGIWVCETDVYADKDTESIIVHKMEGGGGTWNTEKQ